MRAWPGWMPVTGCGPASRAAGWSWPHGLCWWGCCGAKTPCGAAGHLGGWQDLVMKIAPGIHRIGGNSMINAYLVEQAGEVTIIDAGLPGYYGDIDRELATMGRVPADVRALVLTHGHSDHIGFAERLRRERAVPCRFTKPTLRWRGAR